MKIKELIRQLQQIESVCPKAEILMEDMSERTYFTEGRYKGEPERQSYSPYLALGISDEGKGSVDIEIVDEKEYNRLLKFRRGKFM